ncbi:hypothetical protein GCM10027089_35510 [Nocardia thraciensis]
MWLGYPVIETDRYAMVFGVLTANWPPRAERTVFVLQPRDPLLEDFAGAFRGFGLDG